jgi:hypothetical protein
MTAPLDLRVARWGTGWAVFREGKPVTGILTHYDEAKDREIALRRKAAATKRPCLCCRRDFLSAGAHNRLCNDCRTTSADHPSWLVG